MREIPETLYYAADVSGSTRCFHAKDDCGWLKQANRVTDCPTTHPPRGHTCDECLDRSLEALVAAARGEPDTPEATEP